MNTKRSALVLFIVVIVVIAAFIIVRNHAGTSSGGTAADPASLPGMQTGTAPWIAESDNLRERLGDIGFPVLAEEGTALHVHAHLDILIDGKPVAIPEGIGENNTALFTSPIHTEDASGTIHVESPTVQDYTLGQFFDTWGVLLTNDCIGGYCAEEGNTIQVFVNGQPHSGATRDLVLKEHDEIVIAYGTSDELPSQIPASYDFPADE